MKKFATFLLLLFSSSICLASSYEGIWQGFKLIGSSYTSQLLFIDSDGNGFFSFRLKKLRKDFVIPVKLSTDSKNQFTSFEYKQNDNVAHQFVFSQDFTGQITFVIYRIKSTENGTLQSFSWELAKSNEEGIIDRQLYEFSNKNL